MWVDKWHLFMFTWNKSAIHMFLRRHTEGHNVLCVLMLFCCMLLYLLNSQWWNGFFFFRRNLSPCKSRLPAWLRNILLIWSSFFILLNKCTNTHTLICIQPPATERQRTKQRCDNISALGGWSVFVHQRPVKIIHTSNKWWYYSRKQTEVYGRRCCVHARDGCSLPVHTCDTCGLWCIKSCRCQRSSRTLCQGDSGERIVGGVAFCRAPPTSTSSPVIGWGFEMGSQRQNNPHDRFQITINNVCRKKTNIWKDWSICSQHDGEEREVTQISQRFTPWGNVWHAYVSGGNELQDLLHILPAFLFVLWSYIHSL